MSAKHIVILTLGTRGDVQLYVALGVGLRTAGYRVTIAAGHRFKSFITEYGLEYADSEADFPDIMQSKGGRTALGDSGAALRPLREVAPIVRRVLDQEWEAAQGADAIVYHPKALGGYHIAERLGIPGFLGAPFPAFTPTRAFPNLFLPGGVNLGGPLNHASYGLFIYLALAPYRGIINGWRKEVLGLPPHPMLAGDILLGSQRVPKLYCYSAQVIPTPGDFDAASIVTGYWFLEHAAHWQPPPGLAEFIAAGQKPIYVGFGSMASHNPRETTHAVLTALRATGQRGVLATGWGGMAASEMPDNAFLVDSVPHDWLFPQMAAVVHHGGAGTTAAGLRAGKATVICPFFGDQSFWGRRVYDLGVGPKPMPQQRLTTARLVAGIRAVTTDRGMQDRAHALGERIRAEDGVARAVEVIRAKLSGVPAHAAMPLVYDEI